jgi:hypothetical protein
MNWWKRRGKFSKAIIIAGALVVILIAITSGGDKGSTTATTAASVASATTEPPAPVTTQAAPVSTEPPTTVTTAAPQWVEVATLSGKTNKTGDVFELTGAPARMSYDITEGFTAVYIMQEGQDLETDGGFPTVDSMDAIKDSTRLTKDPGSYYLVVKGNSPYTITIEEQR